MKSSVARRVYADQQTQKRSLRQYPFRCESRRMVPPAIAGHLLLHHVSRSLRLGVAGNKAKVVAGSGLDGAEHERAGAVLPAHSRPSARVASRRIPSESAAPRPRLQLRRSPSGFSGSRRRRRPSAKLDSPRPTDRARRSKIACLLRSGVCPFARLFKATTSPSY
jgi:hypothetical protein